jgi:hypothetical protein
LLGSADSGECSGGRVAASQAPSVASLLLVTTPNVSAPLPGPLSHLHPLNPRRKIAKRTGERTDSGKPCMGSACSTILLASTSSRPSAPGPEGSMAPGIDVRKQRESCHGEGATSWWLFLWVLRCGGKRFVTKLRFCGTERKGLGTNHDKRDFADGQQHSSFTLLHPWTALPHRSIEFRLVPPFLKRVHILCDSDGSFRVHNHITHGYSITIQEHRGQSFNFCAASGTISSRIRQLSDHYSYAYRNMLYCFCARPRRHLPYYLFGTLQPVGKKLGVPSISLLW